MMQHWVGMSHTHTHTWGVRVFVVSHKFMSKRAKVAAGSASAPASEATGAAAAN